MQKPEQFWETTNQLYEKKCCISVFKMDSTRLRLNCLFLREMPYSSNWVHSIYFGSPFLREVYSKLNSERERSKIRLRYYSSSKQSAIENFYLESKEVFNDLRTKRRKRWAQVKSSENLDISLKQFRFLPAGLDLISHLVPLIYIRYYRERFIDSQNNTRINFDSQISVQAANSVYLSQHSRDCFPMGVLEFKNSNAKNLHQTAQRMGTTHFTAFSKFAYGTQFQRLGYSRGFYDSVDDLLSSDSW